MQGIGFVAIFPLVFASSTFVPVATKPSWLQVIARHTPITAVADAVRALSLGEPLHELPIVALIWLAAMIVVAGGAARLIYGRMSS
ncbi:MAG: ABC transporter permease [Candidatus Dormibacteraeota bacterium]|nr:ABC transporter permease [Candidatus Dormibacteraeota bacterium]